MSRRHGFTLLEIMLAIMIALLLLTLAVPGIASLFREQDLKKTFDSFDDFVRTAHSRSVTEHRGFRLIFDEQGVTLEPTEPRESDFDQELDRFQFDEGHVYTIERPSALMKDPPAEWPFWESGLCEEAIINYAGPAGTWKVRYDPLTGRGTFEDSAVK